MRKDQSWRHTPVNDMTLAQSDAMWAEDMDWQSEDVCPDCFNPEDECTCKQCACCGCHIFRDDSDFCASCEEDAEDNEACP